MQESHDMTLRDLMPNFRCTAYGDGTVVEIPIFYARMIPNMPTELRDQVREALHGLCRKSGRPKPVYDEVKDNGRSMQSGYVVDIADFDFCCNQRIPGWIIKTEN